MPLRPKDTSPAFWIWCWCSPTSDDVQVIVTCSPSLADGEWSTVALRPEFHVVDSESLSYSDLDRLACWLRVNETMVKRYRRQDVMFTKDFLQSLIPLASWPPQPPR